MPRIDRRVALMAVFMVSIVSVGYVANFYTFEDSLGTDNTLHAETGQSSDAKNDELARLHFAHNAENLSWNSVQLAVSVDGVEYPCMVGGLSSVEQNNGTVQSKLNADGRTFSIHIDATDEENTQYIDLHTMSSSNITSYSFSVATTTVLLEDNVTGVALQSEFSEVENISNIVYDESSEDKLDWYTYDFTNHHIIPDSETYVIEDRGVVFKVQFLSYYDSNNQARHYTLLAAPLNDARIAALTDDTMVQAAPCSIHEDGDSVWNANETVALIENDFDICNGTCSFSIVALFEEKKIAGLERVYQIN